MEPGESSVEILSEAEGLAEVAIESEPVVGGSQTFFEERDGRYVGNVEGSETELTMQDEQVLASVLGLELGAPAIINTAEGFNLSGEPVTWTAIYERTETGIMTTHLEEPRDISRDLSEQDDIFTAPEASVFQKPESTFESPIFLTMTEAQAPEAKGKLWFEQDSKSEDEPKADIIDFFSRGHLFEAEAPPETALGDDVQSEAQAPGPLEDAGPTNVIEALFGQAPEVVADETIEDTAAVEKLPKENNVVELIVGSAELVENPPASVEPVQIEDPQISATEVGQPVEEIESTKAASSEVDFESPELTEVASDSSIDSDVSADRDQAQEVQEVIGAIEVENSALVELDIQIADAAEEASPATVTETSGEFLASGLEADDIIEANFTKPQIASTRSEAPVEIPASEHVQEFYTAEIFEAPAELEITEEPVSVAAELMKNPASIPEAEVPADIEPESVTNRIEPEAVSADEIPAPTKTQAAEQIIEPPAPEVAPEPRAFVEEPAVEPVSISSVPESILFSDGQVTKMAHESENVIRLETSAPDDLDLSAADWAAEFGAPAPEAIEPELAVTSEPKREVRIRRHESGMLDITVTFETESESEIQTKTKKQAQKTMRRAA